MRIHRNAPLLRAAVGRSLLAVCLASACVSVVAAPPKAAKVQPPELPAETLSVLTLAQASAERIYVADIAISHISDGRIRVFDAASGKFLGMVSTGFAGNFALSPKADELYVATSYLARGSRGERTDVLEVHDTTTLGFKYEIVLPPKRAQALNYRGLVAASSDGRWVFVQNATPATSITVVDLRDKKVASEIATPGCWGILPSASKGGRFSMLCGDGKVATVTLDDNGQQADRKLSEQVFDADRDAWFHHAELVGDRAWFISFKGVITEMNIGAETATVTATRPIIGSDAKPAAKAAGKAGGWRPGGYQAFTVDPTGRYAVAAMHDQGTEGSHKRPATQLWVVDLASGKVLAKRPGQGAVSLTLSRSGQRLQALDGMTGAMRVWRVSGHAAAGDAAAGKAPQFKLMTTVVKAGDAALQLESHD